MVFHTVKTELSNSDVLIEIISKFNEDGDFQYNVKTYIHLKCSV